MRLKKEIGFIGIFSISTGAMISSGIFILPGIAYAKAGPAVVISYLIAGILALLGILSTIELSTAMPKAGGDYYFINKTLGPLMGTISGLLGWLALSLKSAFAIFGISEIIFLLTKWNPLLISLILCSIFAYLNIIGAKESTKFQILLVGGLISLIVIYIVFGVSQIDLDLFKPFISKDISSIFITAGFIFISFGGLLKVSSIAEEVKNPKKNLPLGIISSVIAVTFLYVMILIVTIGTLEPNKLISSYTPVADSARIIMGSPGFIIISIASLLAFITTANAGIMAASRYLLALGRDDLLPKGISKISKRFHTPIFSIIITGVIIYASLLLPLEGLIKIASTIILSSYVLTNLSVIILRESKMINYQPSFKAPFYPWLQLFGIIIFSYFIFDLGLDAIEVIILFLIGSFLVYFIYGKRKGKREYALLYLLKRIVDKNLTGENLLESELKEVLKKRDSMEKGRVSDLIKKSIILDLEGPLELEQFFNIVSEHISKKLKLPKEKILKLLLQRQRESKPIISDFAAILHIVIEENEKLLLIAVRCKEGIRFNKKSAHIKAVFLLNGAMKDKILQLRVLASIRTLIRQRYFKKKWLQAKSKNRLKAIILLSKRIDI